LKIIQRTYWFIFLLSIFTLLNSFGLFLLVTGIFILGILILHIHIGLRINYLKKYKLLLLYSSFNLFTFSLIRIDGVHVTSGSGLSNLLQTLNINYFYTGNDTVHINLSIILFVFQLIINTFLFIKSRNKNYSKNIEE